MYDQILAPTDGSDAADAAVHLAIAVADAHDAELHLLYVADTNQPSLTNIEGQVRDVLESEGGEIVEAAADRARSAGVEATTAVVQGGPSRTILDYADDRDIDLVVMGPRGAHGVERILLGSTTERVVRQSPVPVLVVPPEGEALYPPGGVLVGTDGTDAADTAVGEALDVAGAVEAALHAVSVIEPAMIGIDVRSSSAAEERERRNEELLASVRDRGSQTGVTVETAVEEGDVAETLTDYAAEHDLDLIVVGTHGRSGIDRRLLGSVTETLLRSSGVPVLSVRATDGDEE